MVSERRSRSLGRRMGQNPADAASEERGAAVEDDDRERVAGQQAREPAEQLAVTMWKALLTCETLAHQVMRSPAPA